MAAGEMMVYGGIAGIIGSILLVVICMKIFPRQRKKLLEKLSEE